MGVIFKQSVKSSIYSYIGIAIGFLNVAIIAPKILSASQIGLVNILVTYAILFAQLSSLGLINVTTKIFPEFRNAEKNHNGFLFILSLFTVIGFLLGLIVFFLLRPVLIEKHSLQSPLFVEYIYYIIPLTFLTLLFNITDAYNKVLFDAVIGTFVRDVLLRVLYLLIIILYYFEVFSFRSFIILYIFNTALAVGVMIISLIKKKSFNFRPQFNFADKKLKRLMINVGFFGIIAGLSGIAITNIDKIMINLDENLGLAGTGIYSIAFFYGAVILKPSFALKKISSVLISEAWKNNNLELINTIYKKSSINLFVIGILIFLGIWCNIENIFKLLPQEYEKGRYVILFISLANLIEMISGVSGPVIGNSKYYKSLTWFMTALVLLLIITNYIFIPIFGITGAAFASFISYTFFASARYIFLIIKFKFQPINIKHLFALIIGVFIYLISKFLIPVFDNFFIDIFVRSSIITVTFGVATIIFKISNDINEKVLSIWNLIKKIK